MDVFVAASLYVITLITFQCFRLPSSVCHPQTFTASLCSCNICIFDYITRRVCCDDALSYLTLKHTERETRQACHGNCIICNQKHIILWGAIIAIYNSILTRLKNHIHADTHVITCTSQAHMYVYIFKCPVMGTLYYPGSQARRHLPSSKLPCACTHVAAAVVHWPLPAATANKVPVSCSPYKNRRFCVHTLSLNEISINRDACNKNQVQQHDDRDRSIPL